MEINFKSWLFFVENKYEIRPVTGFGSALMTTQDVIKNLTTPKDGDPNYMALIAYADKHGVRDRLVRELEAELSKLNIWTSFSPCKVFGGDEGPMRSGEAIRQSGRYKGFGETGVSGADLNQDSAAQRFSAQHLAGKDQMKYAAIYPDSNDDPRDSKGDSYGNLSIKWNPNALKDRITVAHTDTLETWASNIKISNYDNIIVPLMHVRVFHFLIDDAAERAGINTADPEYKRIMSQNKVVSSPYLEVQIWGKLQINKNTVLGLLVGNLENCTEEFVNTIRWFKEQGIPVSYRADSNAKKYEDPANKPKPDNLKSIEGLRNFFKVGMHVRFKIADKVIEGEVIQVKITDTHPIVPRALRNRLDYVVVKDSDGKELFLTNPYLDPRGDLQLGLSPDGKPIVYERYKEGSASPIEQIKPRRKIVDGERAIIKTEDGEVEGRVYKHHIYPGYGVITGDVNQVMSIYDKGDYKNHKGGPLVVRKMIEEGDFIWFDDPPEWDDDRKAFVGAKLSRK